MGLCRTLQSRRFDSFPTGESFSGELEPRLLWQRSLRRLSVPTEFFANHVEKCAPCNILALQPGCENIGGDESAARGDVTRVANQIIITPAAPIQTLPAPAHGGV